MKTQKQHIKDNVRSSTAFMVTGMGPSYDDYGRIRKMMQKGDTSTEPMKVTEHKFHFCIDKTGEVLVIWFCEGKLYQKQMSQLAAQSLCDSLESNGFKVEKVETDLN